MKKRGSLVLLMILPVCLASQIPQKEWTTWTLADAEKILNDSPWGQTQVDRNMAYPDYGMTVSRVDLRIRFLSAKPIRQALLRILELKPTKDPVGRVDEVLQFANRTFPETIVISVDYDAPKGTFTLAPYMQALGAATTATLKNNTYLLTQENKECFLQEYVPPGPDGLGAKFIFPRRMDGQLVIKPAYKSVLFYSEFPKLAGTTMTGSTLASPGVGLTISMRFKISDFMYRGVLEY